MKIAIRYLMQQPYMNHVKILCGENLLGNVVEGISFLEGNFNNIVMQKNTMILTDTASLLKMSKTELTQLLRLYTTLKISAICLKSNAGPISPENFPADISRYHIPFLLLPEDTVISAVINGINYELIYMNAYDLTHSYEDNFIQEMIFAEQDAKMMERQARMMGIRVNELLCVIMIRPAKNLKIGDFMKQCKTAWGASSFACTRNGSVLLIGRLLTQYETANRTFCDMAARMLETLQQKYPATRLFIGVGHCHKKIADLRSSYYQAKTALLAAMSHSFHNHIVYYDQLGIYKILFDIRNRDNAYSIRNELITPILDYDKAHQTDFYNTIRVYLDHFCSIQETAAAMVLHYNTVRYRIQKIKEELGWDLYSMETCVNLAVGMKLNEFLIDEETFATKEKL